MMSTSPDSVQRFRHAWWKDAVAYQIYPRSFMDSNGDGIGDLPGILARLDYLQWLGIDVIWICPIYRSPNDDNGYDVSDYQAIMAEFGTMADFDRLLSEVHRRGMRLILDFVPNHVAPDHPWVGEHPEYFVHGSADEAAREPASFVAAGGKFFACGRDPYFPAWPDVLQLNAFQPGLRQAVIDTVADIAAQCDGVRCDMAMLMLNTIFERTWGEQVGPKPAEDYWRAIIPAIKAGQPDFKFIAEAYWDLEWELQQQGFDYCYDKKLYDRLEYSNAESVRLHLLADDAYQKKLLRFIENHDEPRAAKAFPEAKGRAAAVATLTLPGGKLLRSVQLFDIYRGPGIAPGKKSVAFSLELRADDRTLTDEDTTGVTNAVLEKLKNDLGVTLR